MAAFVAVLVVATAALVVAKVGSAGPELTRDELLAYQAAVHPPLADGGRVVEQGMRAAVTDLVTPGGVPAATIAGEAQAWERALADVRAKVAAVDPPEALADAHASFDAALARYIEAARAFGRAAQAPEAARPPLVDEGVAHAKAADGRYDAASRALQDWRRRLGLGPTADFPDPSPPAS